MRNIKWKCVDARFYNICIAQYEIIEPDGIVLDSPMFKGKKKLGGQLEIYGTVFPNGSFWIGYENQVGASNSDGLSLLDDISRSLEGECSGGQLSGG